MNITVAIADDQQLFLKSLATLINSFTDFKVIIEAINGNDLIQKLNDSRIPIDIVLTDVKMPVMDGIEAVQFITVKYPLIKTIALSIKDDDYSVLSMIRAGCCAYLMKDVHPSELRTALKEVFEKGYYNADLMSTNYRRLLLKERELLALKITEREKTFLELACSDFTYKEIAAKMFLSEKTIDGYRESLFLKLNVKSRVGMALEAVKQELVIFR